MVRHSTNRAAVERRIRPGTGPSSLQDLKSGSVSRKYAVFRMIFIISFSLQNFIPQIL